MSKLSELLNPVPTQQPSPSIDTSNQSQDGLHTRYPSISSPLEALAIAATGSTPDLSQAPLPTAPLVSSDGHHIDFSNPPSRPGSSHFSLPTPLNFSQTSNQQQNPLSPTLGNHPAFQHQDGTRTLPDTTDGTSRQLPPLRSITPDKMDHPVIDTLANGLQIDLREESYRIDKGARKSEQEDTNETKPPSGVFQEVSLKSPVRLTPKEPAEAESHIDTIHMPAEVKSEFTDDTQVAYTEPISNEHMVVTNVDTAAPGDIVGMSEPTTQALPEGNPRVPTTIPEAVISSPNPQSKVHVTESKKRPAPKGDRKVEKKGTASAIKKPAVKKRKIDTESIDGTPFSQRSGTPVSSRASKTPAPRNRKQNSITPMNSSPALTSNHAGANEDEEMEEGAELFCVCRKPDDHTWMIACDGGCEDWFHGRCVDMNERDGNLIDKYYCPRCKDKGLGQTIWKPMCRLESCREPARVTGSKISKYCSDEHGEQFMRKRALGVSSKPDGKGKATNTGRKRRRENHTDHDGNGDDSPTKQSPPRDEDDQSALRGGVLRAPELKALTTNVQSIHEFRKLGEGVLSPPQTASPDNEDAKVSPIDRMASEKQKVVYTAEEQERLAAIAEKRNALKRGRALLSDREKFLGLVKGRAKSALEELRKREGIKDICGFDTRLTWSDEEFSTWRASNDGQKALETGILGPPSSPLTTSIPTATKSTRESLTLDDTNIVDDTNAQIPNGVSHDPSTTEDLDTAGKGICQRKRCERHKQWFKLQQTEFGFEKEQFRREMRVLEKEEKGVRERATVRHLEGGGGAGEEEVEGG